MLMPMNSSVISGRAPPPAAGGRNDTHLVRRDDLVADLIRDAFQTRLGRGLRSSRVSKRRLRSDQAKHVVLADLVGMCLTGSKQLLLLRSVTDLVGKPLPSRSRAGWRSRPQPYFWK